MIYVCPLGNARHAATGRIHTWALYGDSQGNPCVARRDRTESVLLRGVLLGIRVDAVERWLSAVETVAALGVAMGANEEAIEVAVRAAAILRETLELRRMCAGKGVA